MLIKNKNFNFLILISGLKINSQCLVSILWLKFQFGLVWFKNWWKIKKKRTKRLYSPFNILIYNYITFFRLIFILYKHITNIYQYFQNFHHPSESTSLIFFLHRNHSNCAVSKSGNIVCQWQHENLLQ